MEVENRRSLIFVLLSGMLLVLVGGYLWVNRGYGELSPDTYQFSKALYSACLKKSDEHLDMVDKLLNESDDLSLPTPLLATFRLGKNSAHSPPSVMLSPTNTTSADGENFSNNSIRYSLLRPTDTGLGIKNCLKAKICE